MKRSHAATNGSGVLRKPRPYTVMPDSRSRVASRVKSLSRGHDHEPLEVARVEQIHRVDDQRRVGGVLAARVRELLDRLDRMPEQLVLPARQLRRRPVAVRALDRRCPVLGDLRQQLGGQAGSRVVGVDQNREAWRVRRGHMTIVAQSLPACSVSVPGLRADHRQQRQPLRVLAARGGGEDDQPLGAGSRRSGSGSRGHQRPTVGCRIRLRRVAADARPRARPRARANSGLCAAVARRARAPRRRRGRGRGPRAGRRRSCASARRGRPPGSARAPPGR